MFEKLNSVEFKVIRIIAVHRRQRREKNRRRKKKEEVVTHILEFSIALFGRSVGRQVQ